MKSGREAEPPLPLSSPSKEEKRRETERRRRTQSSLRRRERWIVALGIALHAVYMLSIFDIYFKSPIIHGMEPVPPRIRAPAKRLVLLIVLFNVAFFGTGNFASIVSFEISSVYRFITVFNPFFMSALLIFKLFIPFMLVICVFSAITKIMKVSRMGCYFMVILLSDVMTIHFFFLVRNTGSWMEIGNSISHFGIVSAQVVFVLLLFALTNIYTKDIQVGPSRPSLKEM